MLGFIDGDFLFFHTLHKSSPPRVHLRVLLSHTGYALSALCQVPPWFLFIVSQNYNPMRLIYISKLTSRFLKVNNTLLPHRQCPCGLLVCTVNRTVRWPKTKHWMKPKFIQKEQHMLFMAGSRTVPVCMSTLLHIWVFGHKTGQKSVVMSGTNTLMMQGGICSVALIK